MKSHGNCVDRVVVGAGRWLMGEEGSLTRPKYHPSLPSTLALDRKTAMQRAQEINIMTACPICTPSFIFWKWWTPISILAFCCVVW